jgi:hypothetical protein
MGPSMSVDRAHLMPAIAFCFGGGALGGVRMVHADSQDPAARLDSDSDGIPDTEEDRNHNQQVDHGETDPHQVDTDGDGMSDGDEVRVGTEQNFEWFPNAYLIRWMPQVHWQVHARFQIQAGFGLRHLNGETSPEAATRLIAEF